MKQLAIFSLVAFCLVGCDRHEVKPKAPETVVPVTVPSTQTTITTEPTEVKEQPVNQEPSEPVHQEPSTGEAAGAENQE